LEFSSNTLKLSPYPMLDLMLSIKTIFAGTVEYPTYSNK
jgi:hypothetical protein